jgi:hypothetical protein
VAARVAAVKFADVAIVTAHAVPLVVHVPLGLPDVLLEVTVYCVTG